MAYAVSQNFKTAIKDQTVPKSCLILFEDLFFSTSDFTSSGVIFNQFFNTSDDLTFGDCPSDTLSFSVFTGGTLSGYSFGKCSTYLGVQTASSAYAFVNMNAHVEIGANSYTASDTGLYRNSTKIDNGVYVSLVSDGTYVYAVGLSSSVRVKNSDGTVESYVPNRFMARKLRSGLSAVFSANTAYVWDGENVLTYEYVPMGVYNVTKPRSTASDVVTIQDAYDNMILFNADASMFLASLTYPKTLGQIYTELCNYVGVSYVSSTFTYSTTNYTASPFSDTSCSLRDILWWIAERARRVAHFNRVGELGLRTVNTTVQETLTATDIGVDGYSVAEYITPAVTGVLLRGTNGSSLTFGDMEMPYVISANPFISTISDTDLQAYWSIPRYVPMELLVIEGDPSIDIGNFVDIKPMVDDVVLLTNVYNEIYTNANNEAYALSQQTYTIPIMTREVQFIGGIVAKYTATGNEVREADISDTEYNADVAATVSKNYTDKLDDSLDQQNVFNRLTNNGTAQGIFLDPEGNLYINGTYVQAHTVAVDKLTGTVSNSGWGIDFDSGTMSIGNLSANNITAGSITAAVTASNLTMTGGSISVETATATTDYLRLRYAQGNIEQYVNMNTSSIQVYRKQGTAEAMTTVSGSSITVSDLAGNYSVGITSTSVSFTQPGVTPPITITPVLVYSWT